MTDPELDAVMLRGGILEGGKMRIYALYQHEGSATKRAAFLAREYGLGGHSQTLLNGESGFVDYHGSGVKIYSFKSDFEAQYTWREAEKSIQRLIENGVYLNDREWADWLKVEEKYAIAGGVPYPVPAYRMKELTQAQMTIFDL